ncbi:MAG: TauD/TfdA family dioxygenase [Actinomycetota bacterium]|nr:TauD/TfdA family dioxygenase [Actinomycetota bacterium]
MSVVVDTEFPGRFALISPNDVLAVERIARGLVTTGHGQIDDPNWVDAAREAWDDLPTEVRRPIRAFRRDAGCAGVLLMRGLPVELDAIPPTPIVDGSVQRSATVAAAVLVMIASGLGDPAAFRAEKSGALVQNVVPVPGKEQFQGNAGSVLLSLHNENAFHDHRPDFVMLLCLRADHDRVAGLRTASIRQALPLLSETSRDELFRPAFITQPPPSFGDACDGIEQHPVLFGAPDDPNLRVDFAATTTTDRRSADALDELQRIFGRIACTHHLLPGDLAVVDNRVAVHGRTAFQPRYDGEDRWLQRTFSLTDLRRSRDLRPDDGYVLVR